MWITLYYSLDKCPLRGQWETTMGTVGDYNGEGGRLPIGTVGDYKYRIPLINIGLHPI